MTIQGLNLISQMPQFLEVRLSSEVVERIEVKRILIILRAVSS